MGFGHLEPFSAKRGPSLIDLLQLLKKKKGVFSPCGLFDLRRRIMKIHEKRSRLAP